jgi:hypothetical protein
LLSKVGSSFTSRMMKLSQYAAGTLLIIKVG